MKEVSCKDMCYCAYTKMMEMLYYVFIETPYECILIYEALMISYKDEFVMNHDRVPEWYWYFYFVLHSVFYLFKCINTIFDDYMKQRYRDKTLIKTIVVKSPELLELTYEWKQINYKMLLSVSRMKTNEFIKAENELEVDVTKELEAYLGPMEDWHGAKYTPLSLGYKTLKITKMNNSSFEVAQKTFDTNDQLIKLSAF